MESLYRKYRPQTFDDVVGQRHVVETLTRAVLEGRTSHAYLFCGPRGTGKTTMARLLAKALLCEEGPGHLPDGTCEECRLIAAGEHPDVYELDAASRTGVDNVREEIINRVNYAPARGRYKVYIIDEVHMLTTAAFNALLKTLEEPPEHIVFVLCTTDPQKIPATILSRVQRFDFHAIGNDDIRARLAYVCEQEGFTYDDAALDLVVRHARGGMRDALSTLEQLSVFGDGTISLDAAQDLLGEVPGSALCDVAQALAQRDVATLFGEVAKLVDAGRDLLQFTRELAAHMRDVYVVSAVGAAPGVVEATPEELKALQAEAAAFGSADRAARILAILGDVSTEMRVATNQRLVLEIALTRMARPEADITLDALAERVDNLERQVSLLSRPGGVPARVAASEASAAAEVPRRQQAQPQPSPRPQGQAQPQPQARPAQPHPRPQPPARSQQEAPRASAPARQRPAASTARPEPQAATQNRSAQRPAAPAAQGTKADAGHLQRQWKQVVDTLVRTAASRGSLLMNSTIESDDGATLLVTLPKGSSFALRMLERKDVRATVDPVVQQVFGNRQVRFAEAGPVESGAVRAAKRARARSGAAAQQVPPPVKPVPPAPQPQAQPQPAHPAYEMPWDEPAPSHAAPAPTPAPADDVVPYDDVSASSYNEDGLDEAPVAPLRPQVHEERPTRRQPRPQPAPQGQPAPRSTRPKAQPRPQPQAPAAQASAPQPKAPDSAPAPQIQASVETVSQVPARKIPDDIPPDLTAIIESAFDVFGDGVEVSTFRSEPAEAYEDDADAAATADDSYDPLEDDADDEPDADDE